MKQIMLFGALMLCAWTERPVNLGSLRFTEAYVLAEITKKVLADEGLTVTHHSGLGGTTILWEALKAGRIDLCTTYTGSIKEVMLQHEGPMSADEMRTRLANHGLGISGELGFANTYALAMRREAAGKLGITNITDLKKHPDLKVGLSHPFLVRKDGWQGLRQHYDLTMNHVKGMDHALAYTALLEGKIQLLDAYSTDAKLFEYDLVVLPDVLSYFPKYRAVFLYRLDIDPAAIAAIRTLEGRLDETRMIRLNAEAERTKSYAAGAALFFADEHGDPSAVAEISMAQKLLTWTLRHLQLVSISLFAAILFGVPLGILASRSGPLAHLIMALVGVLQTIPSLALLALLVSVPFLGMGLATAVIALFLYSLLPIVRNTATGLRQIDPSLVASAVVLGMKPGTRLFRIYLPLASPTILAGIKTSAVINVGTATLAALIGAGGLGDPILSGLALNDSQTILLGAVPAAILALVVQYFFEWSEPFWVPKGLRINPTRGKT